ncbi:MAG: hypothetical protein FGF51_04535 [Candidatus Brockarchaeota archaeon]|nr:hypothetical protein [Candidatus Brockarchaeota archaeon]
MKPDEISSLYFELAIFDSQGNSVKEDLETALILSKACSIVIEDLSPTVCENPVETIGFAEAFNYSPPPFKQLFKRSRCYKFSFFCTLS